MKNPVNNPGYVEPSSLQEIDAITSSIKKRVNQLLDLIPGDRVIDVGSGLGSDIFAASQIVGANGISVGLDYDDDMICEAMKQNTSLNEDNSIVYVKADALAIPFASNSFDACRCERLLQHVENCDIVFNELIRVIKQAGRLVIADTDWGTLSVDSSNFEIERKIALFRPTIYQNGYIGRQLYHMMRAGNLLDIVLEVHPVIWTDFYAFYRTSFSLNSFQHKLLESGTVTSSELNDYLNELEEADKKNSFFASGNVVVVAGTKP